MKSVVTFLTTICSLTISSIANAHGPVGGSQTPGDPSLLIAYMGLAAPGPQAPIAVAPSEEPKGRDGAGEKPDPRAPGKDG
jgi:hypothetical protein